MENNASPKKIRKKEKCVKQGKKEKDEKMLQISQC